jgi:hypothetical protein
MERLAAFRDYEGDHLNEVGFRQEGAPELIEQSETYTICRVRHLRGQLLSHTCDAARMSSPGGCRQGRSALACIRTPLSAWAKDLTLGSRGRPEGPPRIFCPQFPNAVPAIWGIALISWSDPWSSSTPCSRPILPGGNHARLHSIKIRHSPTLAPWIGLESNQLLRK